MEDQPWPSTRTASHEGEEDGEGGGGREEKEEERGEEMDTSVLLEQQVP